jgi:hypothetical protein
MPRRNSALTQAISPADVAKHVLDRLEAITRPPYDSGNIGMGIIGTSCTRVLFYKLEKAPSAPANARSVRTFTMGHAIEQCIVDWMRLAGFVVIAKTAELKQVRVDVEGNITGRLDGIVLMTPDAKKGYVLECKSSNEKRFDELRREGLREANFSHYAQCVGYLQRNDQIKEQLFLPKDFAIAGTLYAAVCKNTSRLYVEVIPNDQETFDHLVGRVTTTRALATPPPRIASSADKYPCSYCDYKVHCYADTRGEARSNRGTSQDVPERARVPGRLVRTPAKQVPGRDTNDVRRPQRGKAVDAARDAAETRRSARGRK